MIVKVAVIVALLATNALAREQSLKPLTSRNGRRRRSLQRERVVTAAASSSRDDILSKNVVRSSNAVVDGIKEHYMDSIALVKTSMFLMAWYFVSVVYNVNHKLVVHDIGLPLTIGATQLLCGIPVLLPVWQLKMPKVDMEGWWKKYGMIAFAHMLATMLSTFSMNLDGKYMTVHHVAKALEPFICLYLMSYYDGSQLKEVSKLILAPLAVLVLGSVAACPVKLSQGSWAAFVLSVMSVVFGQMVTTLSKKFMPMNETTTRMQKESEGRVKGRIVTARDNTKSSAGAGTANEIGEQLSVSNILRVVTLFASALAIPVATICEGHRWAEVWHNLKYQVGGVSSDPQMLAIKVLVSGVAHFLMNECAFRVLSEVSPVTLSVGWAARRAWMVLGSAALGTAPYQIPQHTILGSGVAFVGVVGYLANMRNRFDFAAAAAAEKA